MRAGKLRHWLTFQRDAGQLDSDGAWEPAWLDAFVARSRMPCEIVYLQGRELLAAQAMNSKVTCRITTRYRPGFVAALRAVAPDGSVFNIEAVLPDSTSGRSSVVLLASTGVNEG